MSLRFIAASLTLVVAGLAMAPNAKAESDCRFTQGYWQNRAQNAGDLTTEVWAALHDQPFYLSGLTHEQVLLVSPRGNAYWVLAHQTVAALANFTNGADSTGVVADALARADQLLSLYTPAQIAARSGSDPLRQELIRLSKVLDDWNNGLIGSGVCLDNSGNSGS